MATKTQDYEVSTNGQIKQENGAHPLPSVETSAFDHFSKFFGKIKNDPYAMEVWNEIATSRHPRRAKKTAKVE